MNIQAVVYTSRTGHTRQYASLLSRETGLPLYSLQEAAKKLHRGDGIIYLGWIHASRVRGFARAVRLFHICAVCAVGLCDTGTLTEEVRQATAIPDTVALFTLQGGLDRSRLTGADRLLIGMLTRGLAAQKQRSAQDERMLELLRCDGSYVRSDNLAGMLAWYRDHV